MPHEIKLGAKFTLTGAETSDTKATVSFLENNALTLSNTFQSSTVTVTAENGDTKTYTVSVRVKEENRKPSLTWNDKTVSDGQVLLIPKNEDFFFVADYGAGDDKIDSIESKVQKLPGHENEALKRKDDFHFSVSGRGGSEITFSFYKNNEELSAIKVQVITKANYASVEKAIKDFVPEDLSDYTADSVQNLQKLIDSIDYNLPYLKNGELDSLAVQIKDAAEKLVRKPQGVTPADYTFLDAYLLTLPTDYTLYTEQTAAALQEAINAAHALSRDLTADDQKMIDDCLTALERAFEGLRYRPADFSALDEVLRTVPENLSGYSDESVHTLQTLLKQIDRSLDITHQPEINDLTEAIRKAVAGLTKKPEIPAEGPSYPSDKDYNAGSSAPGFPWSRPYSQKKGWIKEKDNLVYYKNGKKQIGWILHEDHWFYAGENCAQHRGWLKLGNVWYYLLPDSGEMVASKMHMIDGKVYAFDNGGGMLSNRWFADHGKWYYFSGNGTMKKNAWVLWKGEWYYLTENGEMAVNMLTPDGYVVNEQGVWVK